MAINLLSKSKAFSPGSDLWIIPELSYSAWSRKIDWYLNFQLGRAMNHKRSPISTFLHTVLVETEMLCFDNNSDYIGDQGATEGGPEACSQQAAQCDRPSNDGIGSKWNWYDVEMQTLAHHGEVIMIAANELLPARYVVVVSRCSQFQSWISAISNIWQNLHCPTMRIFLPDTVNADGFEKYWHTQGNENSDLLIVCG